MTGECINIVHTDDDPDDRELFREALSKIEMKTSLFSFANCEKMLENLLTDGAGEKPNVIFLDINMPGKNGLACLKELKDNPRFAETLIIIFTTSTGTEDIEKARNHGANLFLNKPSDFGELKSLLNTLLKPSKLDMLKTLRAN